MEELGITIIQGVVTLLIAFIGAGTGYTAGRRARAPQPPQDALSQGGARALDAAISQLEASISRMDKTVAGLDRQVQRVTTDVSAISSALITLVTHLDDEIPPKAGDTIIGKVSYLQSREVTGMHPRGQ